MDEKTLERLKTLSEKVRCHMEWGNYGKLVGVRNFGGEGEFPDPVASADSENLAEYIACANPEAILDLINERGKLLSMSKWLAMRLARLGNSHPFVCPENEPYMPIMECVSRHGSCAACWFDAAKKECE